MVEMLVAVEDVAMSVEPEAQPADVRGDQVGVLCGAAVDQYVARRIGDQDRA